jgi:hypothetical protein
MALTVLTGEDAGNSAAWLEWWREHEEGLVIAPKPPESVPQGMLNKWYRYWEVDADGKRAVVTAEKEGADGEE